MNIKNTINNNLFYSQDDFYFEKKLFDLFHLQNLFKQSYSANEIDFSAKELNQLDRSLLRREIICPIIPSKQMKKIDKCVSILSFFLIVLGIALIINATA